MSEFIKQLVTNKEVIKIENIANFITGIALIITAIGAVTMAIIKVYKNTRKEIDTIPNKIRKQAIYDNIIIEKMDSLKEYLNADRVQIYDFHNGGHYANGRSALKILTAY